MIKVIYSKKSGKCDIGRINDKVIYSKKSGYIQRSQENAILDVLMIKVIYSKKSGKCDIWTY